MARKGGLGKGLDALLQDSSQPAPATAPSADSGVREAPIDKIIPNPQQPRQIIKEEQLRELADSIVEHGCHPAPDRDLRRDARPVHPHRRRTASACLSIGWP